jgi:hypothetical protein
MYSINKPVVGSVFPKRHEWFGDHFVLFTDVPEFLKRVEAAATRRGLVLEGSLVEYYDESEYSGETVVVQFEIWMRAFRPPARIGAPRSLTSQPMLVRDDTQTAPLPEKQADFENAIGSPIRMSFVSWRSLDYRGRVTLKWRTYQTSPLR